MIETVEWRDDEVVLGGVVFATQHGRPRGSVTDRLVLYKTRELVDQYAAYLREHPVTPGGHLLELGIWDGGSVAFWHEVLAPARHAALDLAEGPDPAPYAAWAAGRANVATRWGVDQADADAVRRIVATDLAGRVDLVIDDASHLYEPTRASFETLFRLLPPGGRYVVEDWAWAHWPEFNAPSHPWSTERPLTDLVTQLVELAGSTLGIVEDVVVRQGFAVVRRGEAPLPDGPVLAHRVVREPPPGRRGLRQRKTLR